MAIKFKLKYGSNIMARKRIHNPLTGKYYKIAEKSGSKHRKGQIIGKWSPKRSRKKKDRDSLFGSF